MTKKFVEKLESIFYVATMRYGKEFLSSVAKELCTTLSEVSEDMDSLCDLVLKRADTRVSEYEVITRIRQKISGKDIAKSGFREFSYGDVKEWIEKRFSSIDASKWHSIERILRQLAERCVIGRKFFVDGSWVDHGCGKIEKPPSKDVKFYIIKGF